MSMLYVAVIVIANIVDVNVIAACIARCVIDLCYVVAIGDDGVPLLSLMSLLLLVSMSLSFLLLSPMCCRC